MSKISELSNIVSGDSFKNNLNFESVVNTFKSSHILITQNRSFLGLYNLESLHIEQ